MASIHNAKATGFQGPPAANQVDILDRTTSQKQLAMMPSEHFTANQATPKQKDVAPTFTPQATKSLTTQANQSHTSSRIPFSPGEIANCSQRALEHEKICGESKACYSHGRTLFSSSSAAPPSLQKLIPVGLGSPQSWGANSQCCPSRCTCIQCTCTNLLPTF